MANQGSKPRRANRKGNEASVSVGTRAQQALLDVLVGARSAEEARAELMDYARWADFANVQGPDMRRRNANFFTWLDEKALPIQLPHD